MAKTLALKDLVLSEEFSKRLQRIIPEEGKRAKFLQVSLMAAARDEIRNCDPISVCEAILQLARWGIFPDGRYAALVAYREKCVAQVMIAGEIYLLRQAGFKGQVWANVVFENDELELAKGTNPVCVWKPKIKADRGKRIGALAYIGDGQWFDWEFMTMEEIEQIRKLSVSYQRGKGPWASESETILDEMREKVVLRRLLKRQALPQEISERISEIEQTEGSVIVDSPKKEEEKVQLPPSEEADEGWME